MPIGQKNIVDLPGGDKTTEGKGNSQASPKSPPRGAPTATANRELRGRLEACFDRIATAAEARGDTELAEIIREDTAVMANGLVSLTSPFRALRTPIVMVLGIVEPIMAFSRITRVILGRTLEARAERRAAREQEPPSR